jgi:hypothetical protein
VLCGWSEGPASQGALKIALAIVSISEAQTSLKGPEKRSRSAAKHGGPRRAHFTRNRAGFFGVCGLIEADGLLPENHSPHLLRKLCHVAPAFVTNCAVRRPSEGGAQTDSSRRRNVAGAQALTCSYSVSGPHKRAQRADVQTVDVARGGGEVRASEAPPAALRAGRPRRSAVRRGVSVSERTAASPSTTRAARG